MGALRLFLALTVLIGHTAPVGGYFGLPAHVAVRSFFIISGFYIALILSNKYQTRPRIFWAARALRLYPLYWIAVTLAIFSSFNMFQGWSNVPDWQTVLLRLPNITMIGAELPFLLHHDSVKGWVFSFGLQPEAVPHAVRASGSMIAVGPAWSLGLELWFYALAPVLCRTSNKILLVVAVLSAALFYWMESSRPWSAYFFFPANLWFFCLGVAGHRVYRQISVQGLHVRKATLLAISSVILFVLFVRQFIPHFRNYEIYVYLLLTFSVPLLFHAFKDSGADRAIGELSYPIYVIHAPLLMVLPEAIERSTVLSLFACVGAAVVLRYFVDLPIERARQRWIANSLGMDQGGDGQGVAAPERPAPLARRLDTVD